MDAGAGSNEDDITMKLMQIVEVNNILRQGLDRGLPISSIADNWDFLQTQCAGLINSDAASNHPHNVAVEPMRRAPFLLMFLCFFLLEFIVSRTWPHLSFFLLLTLNPPRPFEQTNPNKRTMQGLRPAAQGQAGPLPRQPLRQARRFLRSHRHLP
jgi:hypothetical protein